MTDTTDQQAVTVARMSTRPRCARCQQFITIDTDADDDLWAEVIGERFGPGYICAGCFTRAADERLIDWAGRVRFVPYSLAEQRGLASVSSASAEILAGMKPWHGGKQAPDDWPRFERVMFRNGEMSKGATEYDWRHVDERHDIIAYAPTPEPIPATNQAGEVREGCVGTMDAARATYFLERFKREEKFLGPHEQWALDFTIAALATQPATSQEGEARCTCHHRHDPDQMCHTADCALAYAATPTPPTLSEDLREAYRVGFNDGADGDFNPDGFIARYRAALDLAQVRAS